MRARKKRSARKPGDTSGPAHARQIAAYRRMSGSDRVAVAFRLNAFARGASEAGIRSRHPEYSEEQVLMALRRLWLGDDLTRQAWPDRDLVQP